MSLNRKSTRRKAGGPSMLDPQQARISLNRAPTQRRGAALAQTEQKKGYGRVQQGIKQLYPVDAERETDMDIVFVPGLGAHPENSWKSGSGFNWISDEKGLARDFPKARILLYMYESAWIGSLKVNQDIYNLGYTLLEALEDRRKEPESTRPIIFIGHSMGGLVIAKAICLLASSKKHLFPGMLEDIVSCVLFGTPFGGAEAASLGAMFSGFGEWCNVSVASRLLKFMASKNDGLSELKNEFIRVTTTLETNITKIELYGFYEQQPTKIDDLSGVPKFLRALRVPLPPSISQFVTKESAILGGVMEGMGMASNHRDLVKFESPRDERYALVRGPLKRFVNNAHRAAKNRRQTTRHVDKELVKKAMETLEGAQVNRKRGSIKTAPSSWIPEEPVYLEWLAKLDGIVKSVPTKRGDCLWIRGPEGRGKTGAALAALESIDEMKKNEPSVLLAYFLCDSAPDYDTAEELLKSLIRQLIEQQEPLASNCKFLLRNKGKDESKAQFQLTVENLWQVLQDILSDTSLVGTRIYFVINNLEALQQGSESTATLVKRLGDEINSMNGRRVTVRWLITSDQSWEIGQALDGDLVRLIDLEDEKYKDQVKSELQKHAHEKVSDLVTRRKYSKALAYYVGSLIGKRAQNTQWIDITIVQLEQLPDHDSDRYVRRHLEVVPEKLDELLTSAWRRVFELKTGYIEELKEMLRILVLTFEDPTKKELGMLAGLHDSEEGMKELDELVEQCRPLLGLKETENGEDTVCFIDGVVKEHLLKNAYKLLGFSDEDIKLHHGMLGFRALAHVMEAFNFTEEVPHTENNGGHGQTSQDDDSDKEDGNQAGGDSEDDDSEDDGSDDDDSKDDDSGGGGSGGGDGGGGDSAGDHPNHSGGASEWGKDEESKDEDRAQPYAVKHWLSHASKATAELAEKLSLETEFWERDSTIRQRWLTEHDRLTGSFQGFELNELSGLHVAARIGFRQLVAALIKNGHEDEIDLGDSILFTPLHHAAESGNLDIIEELISRNAPIDHGINDKRMTPLHAAALEGHVKAMKKLLERGANPEAECGWGRAIHAAIESGNRDAVGLLVERDVSLIATEVEEDDEGAKEGKEPEPQNDTQEIDPKSEDDESDSEDDDDEDEGEIIRSPLALAAARADATMLGFLLDKYSHKLPRAEFDTALVKAAEYGSTDAMNRLFQSFTPTRETFQNSLNSAAEGENWDIVESLLEKCRDLDLDCDCAFVNASQGYDTDEELRILEAMWEYTHGTITPSVLNESLYEATDFENEKTVELLLRLGANANATGQEYGNALTASAYDGTIDILKMLMDAGAHVNSPNGWALQTASAQGHRDIVELLLERGANVNAYTKHEKMPQATALQAAVEAGNGEMVELLLEHGANPDWGGGYLTCPIIAAANRGEAGILEQLVKARANLDVFGGPYNSTPLTYAAMFLPLPSVRLLVDAGIDINLADKDGDTALILATWFSEVDCVRFLLGRGANVLHRNNSGQNALQVAIDEDETDCAKVLVDHVSLILEALRVAMESGDASVAAVIRSVENRKQELDYDEPAADPETSTQETGQPLISSVADARDDWTRWESPEYALQEGPNEASQAGSGYSENIGSAQQHHQGNATGASGSTSWKPYDPSSNWKHEQRTPPPLTSSYPTPPPSSGAIRRKPVTTPSPEMHGVMPSTTANTQFPNQPINNMGPQGSIPHQPQQPYHTGGQAQHPSSVGSQQGGYHAYQPQGARQPNSVQRESRVSFQNPQQQLGQSPLAPGPRPPPGMEPRFQPYNPETQDNQMISRPQKEGSRSFLGMNMPWSGEGQP